MSRLMGLLFDDKIQAEGFGMLQCRRWGGGETIDVIPLMPSLEWTSISIRWKKSLKKRRPHLAFVSCCRMYSICGRYVSSSPLHLLLQFLMLPWLIPANPKITFHFVVRVIGCHAEGIRVLRLLIRFTRRLRWKSTESISKCSSSWPRAAISGGVARQDRLSVSLRLGLRRRQ